MPWLFRHIGRISNRIVRRGGNLRVGLVWGGNPNVRNDRFRSPRLQPLLPLFDLPGIEWVVLQQGDGRRDLETFAPRGHIVDIAAEVTDFADTAAIMNELDLVISYRVGRPKVSHEFKLDVQNVLSADTTVADYFDRRTGTIKHVPQLPPLPVLQYTLRF